MSAIVRRVFANFSASLRREITSSFFDQPRSALANIRQNIHQTHTLGHQTLVIPNWYIQALHYKEEPRKTLEEYSRIHTQSPFKLHKNPFVPVELGIA